jgi:hypothetical protein
MGSVFDEIIAIIALMAMHALYFMMLYQLCTIM